MAVDSQRRRRSSLMSSIATRPNDVFAPSLTCDRWNRDRLLVGGTQPVTGGGCRCFWTYRVSTAPMWTASRCPLPTRSALAKINRGDRATMRRRQPALAPRRETVTAGTATAIATGSMLPRGADAVVMIEHTDIQEGRLVIRRPATPGGNISFAGTDIGQGEIVLRRGELLTSRETGVLAALGLAEIAVVRRPRVAILSTGDELLPSGAPDQAGLYSRQQFHRPGRRRSRTGRRAGCPGHFS